MKTTTSTLILAALLATASPAALMAQPSLEGPDFDEESGIPDPQPIPDNDEDELGRNGTEQIAASPGASTETSAKLLPEGGDGDEEGGVPNEEEGDDGDEGSSNN